MRELGGFRGNQLFQVAATVGIARAIGARPCLPPRWSYRPYLNVPDEWFRPARGRHMEAWAWEGLDYMDERARLYLQDPALFRDVADEIRAAFDLSARGEVLVYDAAERERYAYLNAPDSAIAMHVRRGDLLTQEQGYQPALTMEAPAYYRDALRVLDPHGARDVFVFSDDADWCELELPRRVHRYVTVMRTAPPRSHIPAQYRRQAPLDLIDLHLFGRANNLILSNSTFAWWGAWLAGFTDHVLYPSLWFGPKLDYIDTDLLFVDLPWRQVPC